MERRNGHLVQIRHRRNLENGANNRDERHSEIVDLSPGSTSPSNRKLRTISDIQTKCRASTIVSQTNGRALLMIGRYRPQCRRSPLRLQCLMNHRAKIRCSQTDTPNMLRLQHHRRPLQLQFMNHGAKVHCHQMSTRDMHRSIPLGTSPGAFKISHHPTEQVPELMATLPHVIAKHVDFTPRASRVRMYPPAIAGYRRSRIPSHFRSMDHEPVCSGGYRRGSSRFSGYVGRGYGVGRCNVRECDGRQYASRRYDETRSEKRGLSRSAKEEIELTMKASERSGKTKLIEKMIELFRGSRDNEKTTHKSRRRRDRQ